jgi:acetylornithine deacetylase
MENNQLTDHQLLAHLIGFDTTTKLSPKPLMDFVCDYLEHPDIRITRFDCGDGYENVWCETGAPSSSGEGVTLCGHVDTVPALEPDWQTNPWELVIRDGRMYGRGACDMKGFDAIAINALLRAAREGVEFPFALLLTHSEETGTIGAGQFAEQWPAGRVMPSKVLVGEPTSYDAVRAHKGHLTIDLSVCGAPCHTGFPYKGINAITKAMPLLNALEEFRSVLSEERTPESELFEDVPYPVFTISRIMGGTAINIMPERCTLNIGIRMLPGQSIDAMVERVRKVVVDAGFRISDEGLPGDCIFNVVNATPAFGLAKDDPFLSVVLAHARSKAPIGVNYGTDAGRLEVLGCRSVVFGPGDITQAHRANEWISCEEFDRASAVVDSIVREAGEMH